jgi:hypothetical protein
MPDLRCNRCEKSLGHTDRDRFVWCSCGQPIDGAQWTLGLAKPLKRMPRRERAEPRPLVADLSERLARRG